MNDVETTVLYAISTLAQTCAALAAFVGAVGLFRLQAVREELRAAHLNLRRTAANAGWVEREMEFVLPFKDVVIRVEQNCETSAPSSRSFHPARACEGLIRWRNARMSFRWSYWPFVIFETWNLLVILGSLGGFAHVRLLASLWWSGVLLWVVALITVGVTGGAVFVWLGRNGPVEQNGGAHGGGPGWWERVRRFGDWINQLGPWIVALTSVVIAVVSLNLARASNEGAYRAWLTVKQAKDLSVFPGTYGEVTVEIENTGRSPARDVRIHAATALGPRDWQIPERAPVPDEMNVGVIGPGQVRSIPFKRKDPLTDANIALLVNRTLRLFYFADVTYADQFGSDRLLQFCLFYDPPAKTGPVAGLPSCAMHESVR